MQNLCSIRAENLRKSYRIAHHQGRSKYGTLREDLVAMPKRLFRKMTGGNDAGHKTEVETFWALNGASFEINHGETVGIIGRNGAGKSTLLKILSRITHPTEGRAEIFGRVGALLEVGTGFHPELTGRENIFLSGTIMGMSKPEIRRDLDEIVAFAEIEKFLDTPVKRFSSGMYLRLAFSVAAHLDADILIVDEVLAVGDANFQKKCLGKMEEVGTRGRTVLFVSHSMPSVSRLCQRVIVLEKGGVVADGTPSEAIGRYMTSGANSACVREWEEPEKAPGDGIAKLKAVRVLDRSGKPSESINIDEECSIEVEYWNLTSTAAPSVAIHLINDMGVVLFASADFNNISWAKSPRKEGVVTARCTIPAHFLAEGRISVLSALISCNPDVLHGIERDAVVFQVIDQTEGTGVRGPFAGQNWPGVVRPMLEWEINND